MTTMFRRLLIPSACVIALFAAVRPCAADFMDTWTTQVGQLNQQGNPLKAEADFSAVYNSMTGHTLLTITLKNLIQGEKAVDQNLSDLYVTFTDGTNTGTLTSSSGTLRTVASNKTYSDGSTGSTGWVLRTNINGGIKLDDLGSGAPGPAHTILGLPSADNKYDNANSSIAGNNAHNPFLAPTATFTLNFATLSQSARIQSVTFSFGTAAGENEFHGVHTVPEPSSVVIGCIGVGSLGLIRFLRRRRLARAAA